MSFRSCTLQALASRQSPPLRRAVSSYCKRSLGMLAKWQADCQLLRSPRVNPHCLFRMSLPLSRLLFAAVAVSLFPGPFTSDDPAARPSFSEPSFSPDRREIVFASGGDIWTVPASGGDARLLVSHPATDRRPFFSPDGSRLAFTSARSGNGDIYVLTLASGDLSRDYVRRQQ